MERSPYLPLLMRADAVFGVHLGDGGLVVSLDGTRETVTYDDVAEDADIALPYFIEIADAEIVALAEDPVHLPRFEIHADPTAHRAASALLTRLFWPRAADVVRDREEVIYPAIFGVARPAVTLEIETLPVRIHAYLGAFGDNTAYVTSGLSAPDIGEPAFVCDGASLSGFGYELALIAEPDADVLRDQFVAWVRRLCRTKDHYLRGNWLEYAEGLLPGTGLGGFLVVPPVSFVGEFPLGDKQAFWHVLLPATPEEIAYAKQTDVLEVAQRIFEAGYEDWSPLARPSTV